MASRTIRRELTLECVHGVAVELSRVLPAGWRVAEVDDSFVVTGTADEGFENEVWRVARFVAYPAFVSFARTRSDAGEVRYELLSQSARGAAFRVEFVLRVPG